MIFKESSISGIASIDTSHGFSDHKADMEDNEDDDIEKVLEGMELSMNFSVPRILFNEGDVRLVKRETDFFISESDFNSVFHYYGGILKEDDIIRKISEFHNVPVDNIYVILEYDIESLMSRKNELLEKLKNAGGRKERSKLRKMIRTAEKRLIRLRSKGVTVNDEVIAKEQPRRRKAGTI